MDTLCELAATGGMTLKDLLNPRSAGFKKTGLDPEKMTDTEIGSLLVENPKMIRRPLLTDGRILTLGFDPERYKEFNL